MTINAFPIETAQSTELSGVEAVEALESVPKSAYCDYSTNPVLLMTTTPTVLDAWTEESTPVGITESNGEFTAAFDGVYNIFLERIYQNNDNNPVDQVTVEITVEADTGGGWVTIFNRVAPISSATAGDEPAILAFGTPANREVTAGTKFRILVNAQDGGVNPQATYFVRAKVVANLIHKLPA